MATPKTRYISISVSSNTNTFIRVYIRSAIVICGKSKISQQKKKKTKQPNIQNNVVFSYVKKCDLYGKKKKPRKINKRRFLDGTIVPARCCIRFAFGITDFVLLGFNIGMIVNHKGKNIKSNFIIFVKEQRSA